MARHQSFPHLTLSDLDSYLRTLREVIDIVHKTSTEIDVFKRRLEVSLKEASAANKLMRLGLAQRNDITLGPGREILTVARLATELGVSRSTVQNMVGQGRLPPPFKIKAGSLGFRRSEILKWIADEAENESIGRLSTSSTYITKEAMAFLQAKKT